MKKFIRTFINLTRFRFAGFQFSPKSNTRSNGSIFHYYRRLPFGLVRNPCTTRGKPRFFWWISSWLFVWTPSCCSWWRPLWVACLIAERFRCLKPLKKWTAGFASPNSEDATLLSCFVISSQAYITSSAAIPIHILLILYVLDTNLWFYYHVGLDLDVLSPFAKHKQFRRSTQLS